MDDPGVGQQTRPTGFERASDAELARGMASGDEDECDRAWREFYARGLDRALRMIRFLAAQEFGEDDIGDMLGETVDRMTQAVGRFRSSGDGSLVRWACTIARNVVMDHRRERSAAELVSYEEMADRLGADVGSGYGSRLEHADFERLHQAFFQLAPRDQAIVAQHCAGRSYQELAAMLGLNSDLVRKVWHKAIERLKKRYEDGGRPEAGGRRPRR